MVSGRRIPELAFLDGRVSGDDGVNLGEGTYSLRGNALTVAIDTVTSLQYGSEPLVEYDLFEYLRGARLATVHADFLHIAFGEGSDELVYHSEVLETPA